MTPPDSPQTVHALFAQRAASAGEAPFLWQEDGTVLSYRDVCTLVDIAEAELRHNGVRAGDRVLAIAENCAAHVALVFACSRVGAWSCSVNARMAPGELAGILAKADPRIVYFTSAVSPDAAAHARRLDAKPSTLAGLEHGATLADAVAETGAVEHTTADAIAAIIFTSGTTGTPKGVLVSHAGLLNFARASAESRALGLADRVYAYLPMTHIFGLATVLMSAVHAGASLVMRSRFSPQDIVDSLASGGVSNLQGPPTLFARLLAHLDAQGIARPVAPQLRYLYTGAAPLDLALKQQVEARFGQALHHGYGLSEYAGAVAVTPRLAPRSDTSAGHCFDGARVRIVGKDGSDLPAGERGEIWIHGVGVMPGYFRDEAATRAVIKPGGWYATGDLGRLADDGALFVVGRSKEMIVRSGFNVYPAEVESVLNHFPAIHRSAVVGQIERDGNEAVIAFVELRPGAVLDRAALDAYLADHLAPYKRPAQFVAMAELPTTLSGKLIKRHLRVPLPDANAVHEASAPSAAGA